MFVLQVAFGIVVGAMLLQLLRFFTPTIIGIPVAAVVAIQRMSFWKRLGFFSVVLFVIALIGMAIK